MNDETVLPTEAASDPLPEPSAPALEGETSAPYDENVETLTVVPVDYTPVIYEVGNGLAKVQFFCAFLIVGVLLAFKLWGVKFDGS